MIKVLVIDDEHEVRTMLYLMLVGEGYEVQRAASGREALQKYRDVPADVVVTDMRMPEMDGLEVIRRLKEWDEDLAAIILTAYGELETALVAFQTLGVYNYLTKPLENPEVLITAVEEALEKRQLRLENKNLVARLEAANKDLEIKVEERTKALAKSNRLLSEQLQQHKESERKLSQSHMDLEQRIVNRTAKLSELNRQLTRKVNEHRKLEDALRISEMKAHAQFLELNLLYSSAPVGICILDEDFRFLKANEAMADMVGTPLKRLKGLVMGEVNPYLARQILPACHRVRIHGKPVQSYMVRLPRKTKDRASSYWLASSYPLLIEDGNEVVTSHIFQDITDLRFAQEHIRQSKIMLQAVFDGISDPLIMVDRSFKIRMLNRAAKNYYSIEEFNDLIGKSCDEMALDQMACDQCQIPQAVSSGRAMVVERDGFVDRKRIEKVTVYPLSHSATGLDGSIIQITDITETKKIERQMVRNEKLASLGLLVSGVAHEINNPNNFITFNIPILKSYLKAILANMSTQSKETTAKDWFGMNFTEFNEEVYSLIDNLEHGAVRIADIVSSLRALVRAETGGQALKPCSIQKLIGQVTSLCRSEIQKQVRSFIVECPEDLPMVILDAAALEQVLINLLINASHATDKDDSEIRLIVAPIAGETLEIEVRDNGVGMTEDTLERIFDPFFTTKEPGVGTGLGLSVSHSLVNGMKGSLQVTSTPEVGSVFNLRIPIQLADQIRPSKVSGAARPAAVGLRATSVE